MATYRLYARDWIQIEAFAKILEVCFFIIFIITYIYICAQVPHAFQQKLSSEKTPTLCEALPSFQRMITTWEQYKQDMPEYAQIIEAGLSKLQTYFNLAIQVPAYQLAICMKFYFLNIK